MSALPSASDLGRLAAPDAFLWAVGIEDTFITAPHPRTGRTLDEYELTGHYDRWREDLALIAQLGTPCARYGVPWHRVQPAPNVWAWGFVDAALERMLALKIDPIVDLVHYGLPPWIERAFLNPDYPYYVAEYAARLAERFRGRVRWYTPLNEPRITAWYCGRLGWWPPYERSWRGFVALMIAICQGIVETVRALQQVDAEIVPFHVDATDMFDTDDPTLVAEARRRQEIVFLALDLISGRVDRNHALWDWLISEGADEDVLENFLDQPLDLPIIGVNLYPIFTSKRLLRDAAGRLRIRMPHASGDLVEKIGRMYFDRYGAPLMVSETADKGSAARRLDWLRQSVAAVRRLRVDGVPMLGYTWWPMFALVTWAYRQGRRPLHDHLLQMGLWDLDPDPNGQLARLETPLVGAYRDLVRGGSQSVGPLAASGAPRSPMRAG
ncbi:family 1 glycosylhydrolase [Methylocystis echinoides]|uniref:family 1 glycosylhydrolase n=1 Tax=Methylocystis echinoides TaxID=29468 RepID=UPI0034367762